VSPDPLSVPASCRAAYQRYAAGLGRSALAARTRAYHARAVRRFLCWLPGNAADIGAVLSQPAAWDAAVTRFIGELAAGNGPLSADLQVHRGALADCACRLGLAQRYVSVPDRFGRIHDAYTAAATTTQAAATRDSNQAAVRAFLRWLDRTGYTGDLRRDWATAATGYLEHLSGKGNAASTVLRQRAALNDCAASLNLPRVTLPPRHSRRPVRAGANS
jgi:hypothetical protein